MEEVASALLRLQEIDLDLMRAKVQLEAMPQAAKLISAAQAKKKLASELKRAIGARKDIEIDIADLQDQHAAYEQERLEVKASIDESSRTYKEVQALDAKLSSLAKKLEKIEFNLGPLLDKLEAAKASEDKLRAIAARLLAEEESLKKSFSEDSADIQVRIADLNAERVSVVSEIPEDIIARYDAASKRFGGLAVERLHGNVPSTCRVKLQEEAFRKLSRGPVISECPYCHRILVVEEL